MTPSLDMAMFSGEVNDWGGSRDRRRSPKVVWTKTGPPVNHIDTSNVKNDSKTKIVTYCDHRILTLANSYLVKLGADVKNLTEHRIDSYEYLL
jgi:hypothetical protein